MKRKWLIIVGIVVIIAAGFFYLNWTMFGDRSSFQTGLASYQGIPNSASDITIYENKNISGTFLADFKIAESDFATFASSNSWAIQPIANTEYVFRATAFNERRPNDKKEITDGLYYSKRAANGGGITVAYDRKRQSLRVLARQSKAAIQSPSVTAQAAVQWAEDHLFDRRSVVREHEDRIVSVKGKGLEPLCDALERLAVERFRVRPEKYEGLGKSESVINEIEIIERQQKVLSPDA